MKNSISGSLYVSSKWEDSPAIVPDSVPIKERLCVGDFPRELEENDDDGCYGSD